MGKAVVIVLDPSADDGDAEVVERMVGTCLEAVAHSTAVIGWPPEQPEITGLLDPT